MKIAFIQNKGGNYGGVWQVNKTIGEALIKKGHEVRIISIRDDHLNLNLEHDEKLKVVTINEKDLWHTYHGVDFKESLKSHHYIELIKRLFHRLRNNFRLKCDSYKLNKYLDEYNPDFIITSHYQILDMLSKNKLSKTFHEQHSSLKDAWKNNSTRKTFLKYKDKIKFIWLCQNTCDYAKEKGLLNSVYLYNPVRFKKKELNKKIVENKRLVSIAMFRPEKRLDLMVTMLNKLFSNSKYHDWEALIYGDGPEFEKVKNLIKTNNIKLMGSTDNPKDILSSSSINLNTSSSEGFCLSILEASECGVPTISFDFGESASEQIIDGETGFICQNEDEFMQKLELLMNDNKLLEKMSLNTKENNKKYYIENIVNDWEKLFVNNKK